MHIPRRHDGVRAEGLRGHPFRQRGCDRNDPPALRRQGVGRQGVGISCDLGQDCGTHALRRQVPLHLQGEHGLLRSTAQAEALQEVQMRRALGEDILLLAEPDLAGKLGCAVEIVGALARARSANSQAICGAVLPRAHSTHPALLRVHLLVEGQGFAVRAGPDGASDRLVDHFVQRRIPIVHQSHAARRPGGQDSSSSRHVVERQWYTVGVVQGRGVGVDLRVGHDAHADVVPYRCWHVLVPPSVAGALQCEPP
mmetsp:Transcript_116986/g.338162  ORF Transcript_116986/g.338162 Transcript_116986/m.338162 type:complete len:254 (-) Transcript_116986:392-1153(-)